MTITEYLGLVETAISAMPDFNGIGVVVDKQQDVEREKEKHLAKCKGYAVIIGETSNKSTGEDLDGPPINLQFGVTIYTPKIVRPPKKTGAKLRDLVMRRLHNSKLQPNQHCYVEAKYLKGRAFIEKKENKVRMIHALSFKTDLYYDRHPELET